MRRVMDEMRENMRRANPVEDLVHRTDSPFTALINGHPLPLKFKMPSLDSYDGTRDPFDHIATFKTTMHLQGVPDEIMCRAFPTTLKGPARVWFSKIPSNSVSSFEELRKLFVNNIIGGQRHKRSSSSLLSIEQWENESLRSFITRFNREALTVDEVDDKFQLIKKKTLYTCQKYNIDFAFDIWRRANLEVDVRKKFMLILCSYCVPPVYMEAHFQLINKTFTYIYIYIYISVQLLVGAPPDYSCKIWQCL